MRPNITEYTLLIDGNDKLTNNAYYLSNAIKQEFYIVAEEYIDNQKNVPAYLFMRLKNNITMFYFPNEKVLHVRLVDENDKSRTETINKLINLLKKNELNSIVRDIKTWNESIFYGTGT